MIPSSTFAPIFTVRLVPNISYVDLKNIFSQKNYVFFTEGYFNLNIFGIRSIGSQSNKFDDFIGCAYMDKNGKAQVEIYPATTDPGNYYLKNPLNKKGTLIMVPGQYRSAYKYGVHGRSGNFPYEALEQVGIMTYVRDNNRDLVINTDLYEDPKLFERNKITGVYKTNIHRASKWKVVRLVERYSAGCQVIQDPHDFDRLMELATNQIKYGNGEYYTYTLLTEEDIL